MPGLRGTDTAVSGPIQCDTTLPVICCASEGETRLRLDAADGEDAGPNVDGIEPPDGTGVVVPPGEKAVNKGPEAVPIDETSNT